MWSTRVTLADDTTELVDVYEWDEAPLPELEIELRGRGWKKGNTDYLNAVVTLDTETSKLTHFDESGVEQLDGCWVYQWAVYLEGVIIAGRTADDLLSLLKRIYDHYELGTKKRLVCYIHNLGYDFTYLSNGLWKTFNQDVSIFATGQRRAVKVTCGGGLELRCSWKLVNKSLAAWCADRHPRHKKLKGAIDYNVLRTPQTKLTITDWDYMLNDILCQADCLREELQGERFRTVPMTSTGFVRRSMRYASMRDKSWRERFQSMIPTAAQYQMQVKAFAGGYTHANSLALGIWHDATGFDAASMYPAVMATEPKFPKGPYKFKHIRTRQDLDTMTNDKRFTSIFEISLVNLRLKEPSKTWNPYIAYSKCYNQSVHDVLLDNGKVIAIRNATMTITELDWYWIQKQYTWKTLVIHRFMYAECDYLPKWFRDELLKWYKDKVQLKGNTDPETERRYMESKQHLNALYGLCATHIIHPEFAYDFIAQEWKAPVQTDTEEAIQEELDKLKKPSSKAFLPYCYGLLVTALARDRLFRVMECCKFPLYSDTDSVKGCDWDMDALNSYNAELKAKSDKAGFTIKDPKGRERPIGVFELDGEYKRFSALHAKCYAYEDYDDNLHCTIAGVTRDNGYPKGDPRRITKEDELGTIEALQDGKVFTACGGTRAIYKCEEHDIVINGEHIHSYGGCAIINTTYEIGGTNDLLAMYGLSDPELPYK